VSDVSDRRPDAASIPTPELLETIRQWVREDPQAVGRLLDEICLDESTAANQSSMCRDAVALAEGLGYSTWELLEAAVSLGLARTVAFLRREAAQRRTEPISGLIM
jgi:hypothetical protein